MAKPDRPDVWARERAAIAALRPGMRVRCRNPERRHHGHEGEVVAVRPTDEPDECPFVDVLFDAYRAERLRTPMDPTDLEIVTRTGANAR